MSGSGPHVLVNLLLEGKLETMLREWSKASWDDELELYTPPVPYDEITRRINDRLNEIADKFDAPRREFNLSTIRHWVLDVYRIRR